MQWNKTWPVLLALPVLAWQLPAENPDEKTPAEKRYEAIVAEFAKADALDIKGSGAMKFKVGEELQEMTITGEVHFAKPLHGSVNLQFDGGSFEGVADGKAFYMLNREGKSYTKSGSSFVLPWPELAPVQSWKGDELAKPNAFSLIKDAEHEGLQGLKLEYEARVETLWLNAKNELKSADVVMTNRGQEVSESFQFETFSHASAIDLKNYMGILPEGFTLEDPMAEYNKNLLKVGTAAPAITMTNMADEEFTLASLKGKTVFMNFWFFH